MQLKIDTKDLHPPLDLLTTLLRDDTISKRSKSSIQVETPTFHHTSLAVSSPKASQDLELELFSPKLHMFTHKLNSISLPDRLQLVKRTRLDRNGNVQLGFNIHSMDQSLELEESFFNQDEFSIGFGNDKLLEFSFKKAEGIKIETKRSHADILIDQETLEKFKYKHFAIGLSVEGEAKSIGSVKKKGGMYMIRNVRGDVLYKIQKLDNFSGKCQKVFLLNERENVIGGLDLVHLNERTFACTVLFPQGIRNIEKLLIIGTVFILMLKISPLNDWLEQINPSNQSYIYGFIKKVFGRLCPRRR